MKQFTSFIQLSQLAIAILLIVVLFNVPMPFIARFGIIISAFISFISVVVSVLDEGYIRDLENVIYHN